MNVTAVHLHSSIRALIMAPAVRVPPTTTLAGAAVAMSETNSSALLIGDHGAGIVTERDLTRALAYGISAEAAVVEVATPLPITVPAATEVLEAAALMLNEEVRHLVVDMPDGSKGILSLRSLLAVLLQAATPEIWLTRLRLSLNR